MPVVFLLPLLEYRLLLLIMAGAVAYTRGGLTTLMFQNDSDVQESLVSARMPVSATLQSDMIRSECNVVYTGKVNAL
jgi:hypothetical protein